MGAISNQNQKMSAQTLTVATLEENLRKQHIGINDIRCLYLYGSSLYQYEGSGDMGHGYVPITSLANDLDILCIQDNFHHHGLSDVVNADKDVESKNVYMQNDVTLHFTIDLGNDCAVEVEVHVMSTQLFIESGFCQHRGILSQTIFLDKDVFILKEDSVMKHFRTFWFRNFHFHRRLFRSMIVREADVWCYSKSKRLWEVEKDYLKSKKNLIHGIRYYRLAHQIVDFLTINDFTVANQLKLETLSVDNDDKPWDFWFQVYDPLYNHHRDHFNTTIDAYIDTALDIANRLQNEHLECGCLTMLMIEQYGLQYLSLNLGMQVIPIHFFCDGQLLDCCDGLISVSSMKSLFLPSKHSFIGGNYEYYHQRMTNLLEELNPSNNFQVLFKIFQPKELERPEESVTSTLIKENNGLIVCWDSFTGKFSLVAFPFVKFYDEYKFLNASTKNKMQNNRSVEGVTITKVFKMLTGQLFVLYNYGDSWFISYQGEEAKYFAAISRQPLENQTMLATVWKILEEGNILNALTHLKTKTFMLQLHNNELILIGIRDVETMKEEQITTYGHIFNILPEEDLSKLVEESLALEQDLLYKNNIKCRTGQEKSSLLLFKLLYHKANQLDPLLYKGFTCMICTKEGNKRVKIQSTLYYNITELSIWHTSLQVSEDNGKFNRVHGNINSQNNETLLVEIALSLIDSNDEEVTIFNNESEKTRIFTPLYVNIKKEWKGICELYNTFMKFLYSSIQTMDQTIDVNKYIAEKSSEFPLENKTPLFKMIEFQLERVEDLFKSARRVFDSRTLLKMWRNYQQKKD